VIDHLQQKILCVAVSAGKTHDFALFKRGVNAVERSARHQADDAVGFFANVVLQPREHIIQSIRS
jgi:hypothetical protein